MAPTDKGAKQGNKKGMKGGAPGKRPASKGKKNQRYYRKQLSKVDKEIKEIEGLQKRISELQALPEEEQKQYRRFDQLPLSNYTKQGLSEAGFTEMTDIQHSSVLNSLFGRDILGCAKTGSGKTLAFLIPALECLYRERWDRSDGIGVLVISPVRELAIQIFDVLCTIGKYHSFSAGLIIGGKDLEEEQERIMNMNILVCTPGRLLQHMEQTPGFDCSNVRVVVIDEVDRCLDMGFKHTIDLIMDSVGGDRQTLLYSATVGEKVKELANGIQNSPVFVNVLNADDFATPKTITQRYVLCDLPQKIEVLFSFIKSHLKSKTLVFTSSRKEVRFLYESFRRMKPGVPLLQLHGKQKQTMRTHTYYDFLQKEEAVLFCTDIAARGLDFPSIDWVVQFDCPEDSDTYIHRVGRAGRFRTKGNSLLFLLPSEEAPFLELMVEAKVPLKRISVNPSQTQSITKRLMEEVARDQELNHLAVTAFQSYVRSVYLASNKALFDVSKLDLEGFAESLGLGVVPNVNFLKKRKKIGSYQLQQLKDEMKEEKEEKKEEEEESSDEELLVKTGVSTVSLNENELPSLPQKSASKRLRISAEPSAKSIRFDDDGNVIKEKDILDIDDVANEIGESAVAKRVEEAKGVVEQNEEKVMMREKQRIREKKLTEKIKEREKNARKKQPAVTLGNGEESEGEEEEEEE